jgi:DNA-directed RNA polymerase subunit delta
VGLETLSAEEQQEMSMVDLALEILKSAKQPLPFQDIVDQLREIKELPEEEIEERIARFYTNMNLDGRFISVGENHWGLRNWYPFDQKEEDIEVPKAKRKKKKPDDDEDEYEDEVYDDEDDEDDDYEEDVEDYEDYEDYGVDEEEHENPDEEEEYR